MENMLVKCKVRQANHRLTDIMTCGAAVTALNRIAVSCSCLEKLKCNKCVTSVNAKQCQKAHILAFSKETCYWEPPPL